jgi:hypothetical protein
MSDNCNNGNNEMAVKELLTKEINEADCEWLALTRLWLRQLWARLKQSKT